jgi:hypothetical protein
LIPCRLIAPDPRFFALHKLWLAKKPGRNPLKRPKDEKQGTLLLSAVAERMPHYPLDDTFRGALPPELLSYFDHWRQTRTHNIPGERLSECKDQLTHAPEAGHASRQQATQRMVNP